MIVGEVATQCAADPVEGSPGLTRAGIARDRSIDLLRGFVITLMVLDHVRDFFHYDAQRFDPTDPAASYPLLFATRWVTHLCAPTFVLLAGVSIYLQKANGKPPRALSEFLLKRGAWLILLEVTLITFAFNFGGPMLFLQVIAAIGFGMLCMSLLSRLTPVFVLVLGVAMIALCALLLPFAASWSGNLSIVAFAVAPRIDPSIPLLAVYPLVPWLGIMCIGFGLGPVFRLMPRDRARSLFALGVGMVALFGLLRFFNVFADPKPWVHMPQSTQTVMSFLNVSKYPPSPGFVLLTVGLAMLLFTALDKLRGPVATLFDTFGRTSLFTYICHVYIAHGLMLVVAIATGFPSAVATNYLLSGNALKLGWGYSLPIVYLIWMTVLASLYPLSRWFDSVKRRGGHWWLAYL